MNTKYVVAAIVVIIILIGSIAAYIFLSSPSGPSNSTIILQGAGATFPYPLLDAMITDYSTNIKPNVQVNYQSIGSGGGIAAMHDKTVDFGASDAPLTAADMENVPGALCIPETAGAVTVAYNIPGLDTGLRLTGQVIADIFQGTITMWNDLAIQALNPTTNLPSQAILTVHRSDGSGTTFIFTSYLSEVSTSWSSSIGAGKSVSWPAGTGSAGNTGVASTVSGTAYSIGYVELAYILQNGMTVAAIQNPAGNWVLPSLDSTTEAVQSGASMGLPAGDESWTSVSLLNAPGTNAYPIVSFTYLIVYKELKVVPQMTQEKATALVQFLWYVIHDGQNLSQALEYAKLPSNVVQIDETTIHSITFDGQTLSAT